MDKVSVVIATYKRFELLPRAIESVLKQTYGNIEILVVDDNPPASEYRAKTAETMRPYLEKYGNIIYIQNEKNMGGALTRNAGIFAATGDYITFLDDDDEYLPEKVKTQLEEMQRNHWDASVMDGATYDENDTLISEKHQKLKNGMSRDELLKTNVIYHITGTNTFMFKAEKLREIHGFDDIPACQEYILMQKTINAGMSVGYIPKILVKNHIYAGERLSTSLKKVSAQNFLLSEKKKYFSLLTFRERRAVLCRHYGVLLNIYVKNHKYGKALWNGVKCGIASPPDAVRWFMEYKHKLGA